MKMLSNQELKEFLLNRELLVVLNQKETLQQIASVIDWLDNTKTVRLRQRSSIYNTVTITPASEAEIDNAIKIGRFINIETRRNGNRDVLQFERKTAKGKWKQHDISYNKSK